VAGADEDEVALAEIGLHARALDDRVARRAPELRRREEEPRAEYDNGERECGRSRVEDATHVAAPLY
jgi:hypothetical protein